MLNYLTNRYEEKRQAFDLLKNYNPWGKPGCGAPNPIALRRHNLLTDGIFPELKFKRSQFPESAILDKRRNSRNRSAARSRHRDSTLYYHPNSKAIVDNILRWKTPVQEQIQYRKCLDDIIIYKKNLADEETKKNIEYEKKMLHSHGPWGARGPGGRPWRQPGQIGKDFFESMGWTTESSFNFPPINKYSAQLANTNNTAESKLIKNQNLQRNVNREQLQAIENIPPINNQENCKNPYYANENHTNKDNVYDKKGCTCEESSKPFCVPSSEERRGGTPNSRLLEMTGGIELVPLLRARGKPPLFSTGNKKWKARDTEYLRALTEQIRMQQGRRQ